MKKFILEIMPPLLIRKLRQLIWKVTSGNNRIDGYQNQLLVDLVLAKNLQLRETENPKSIDLQSLRTIAAIGMGIKNKSDFTVLDFGGGAGHHQFIAKLSFKEIKFDWTVVETESLSQSAQSSILDEGLTFISSLDALHPDKHFDLVFSNAAIQYTQEPLRTLKDLLSRKFTQLFITRIPLTHSRDSFSYIQESMLSQNGPGSAPKNLKDIRVNYTNNIVSKELFEKALGEHLQNWISVDEGAWDLDLFGDRVRTYSYFGVSK
jgi:putative methyltransferase (TIGR04325 family)